MFATRTLQPLTDEQLFQRAPSIMADHPFKAVSHKYKQVPTIEVVNIMRDQGWMPVLASQKRSNDEERRGYTKHMIRFQRESDMLLSTVGDETLQAVLTNSHDRTSAFVFALGVFRLVCSNGLVVARGMFREIRIRHVGFNPKEVVRASGQIGEGGKLVAEHIQQMRDTPFGVDKQLVMAHDAVPLLLGDGVETGRELINPFELIRSRRHEDEKATLWSTFNRLQENMTKGGVPIYRQDKDGEVTIGRSDLRFGGRERRAIPRRYSMARTRPVKSIDRDLRLNQSLWAMAERARKAQERWGVN